MTPQLSDPRCGAIKASDGKPCGNRACFVYQVVQGRVEYFCGIHGRHIVSRNLREIER